MREFEAAASCTPTEYVLGFHSPLENEALLLDDLFILVATRAARRFTQMAVRTPFRLDQIATDEFGLLYYFSGHLLGADLQPQTEMTGHVAAGIWHNPNSELRAVLPQSGKKVRIDEGYFQNYTLRASDRLFETAVSAPTRSRHRGGRPPLV